MTIPPHHNHPTDSQSALLKSTSIVSAGTLTSRILGFIRDMILAGVLGTASKADSFFVALRIPNLFRDLLGEGAANAAIVPVLSEYVAQKKKEDVWHVISVLGVMLTIVVSVITLFGMAGAPLLVRLMAPGFWNNPEQVKLTVDLTRVMFPYLILIGLTAYGIGISYAYRSFIVPAFTPCLFNLAIIISAVISYQVLKEPVWGLAVGVLAGGVLQLLAQVYSLRKQGIRWRGPFVFSHPGAKKIGRLLVPRLFGLGVYQLNVFVDTFCASLSVWAGAGAISAIYYANRIIQFPIGLFGFAMASAVLPTFSDLAVRNETEELKKTLDFSLKNVFFVMIPCSVFLLFMAHPVIRLLFERGEFDSYSSYITSWTLLFYGLGLMSFGAIKILVTAFYALQDTATPVRVAGRLLLLNTILNFILMVPLKVGGIALASSIAAAVNFLVLYKKIGQRLGGMPAGLGRYFQKVLLVSAVMGLAVFWLWHNLILNEWVKLMMVVIVGGVVFGVMGMILKIEQIGHFVEWLKTSKARSQK